MGAITNILLNYEQEIAIIGLILQAIAIGMILKNAFNSSWKDAITLKKIRVPILINLVACYLFVLRLYLLSSTAH